MVFIKISFVLHKYCRDCSLLEPVINYFPKNSQKYPFSQCQHEIKSPYLFCKLMHVLGLDISMCKTPFYIFCFLIIHYTWSLHNNHHNTEELFCWLRFDFVYQANELNVHFCSDTSMAGADDSTHNMERSVLQTS